MYVRMVWGKLRPGTWQDYEHHYQVKLEMVVHDEHTQNSLTSLSAIIQRLDLLLG